jgi:D-3-phosphoglycerate dehydrogenase
VKVLISDKLAQEGIDILEADPDIDVDVKTGLSPEELKGVIGDYEAIIVRSGTKLTADILSSACKLRAIARAGVGIDNVDVEAASRAGIVVMNTPGGNTVAAAEHTMAMMLALARNISPANASMRAGEWDRKRFMGTQLAGKTLGIIGLGRIGREVANRAASFDLRVIGHDPFISRDAAAAAGVALVDTIEELCRASHYITVHVPLTDQTCNMVSRDLIAKMRDGVRIINCSRGCVVNEDDLYEALVSGKVAGAALDVFAEEPPQHRKLIGLEQMLATPHLGASTAEAQVTVAVQAAQQVLDALKGRGLRNAVNLPTVPAEEARYLEPFVELARKVGVLLARLSNGRFRRVEITYAGDLARHNVDLVNRSFMQGVLSAFLGEGVNPINAPMLAEERGIDVSVRKTTECAEFRSLFTAAIVTDTVTRSAAGTMCDEDDARLVGLDGFSVEVVPEGEILVVFNEDKPGIIGELGKILGDRGINIARLVYGRKEAGGPAITVMNLDAPPDKAVLDAVRKAANVKEAYAVNL